ncbi:MAG: ribonuclease J [Sandaracinaceae bacterium]|nr:ribonuclease J [Sandaracinaceae bacterium]
MSSSVRIVPLGGLGEIGMNCMAIDAQGSIVVVDCGVMFPDRSLGIDVIHPDFSYLLARRKELSAIVLTHGHEDHIGAVPYLLREINVPVYGPRYALSLVKERLVEHRLDGKVDLIPTKPRQRFALGGIEVEPVRVTHSIADATALVFRTPAGVLVHTGDFKMDPDPTDEEPFDTERFSQIGDEGVRMLLSDSTNADVPGSSGSESEVFTTLARVITAAKARVVVSMFASNVHRLRAIFAAAQTTGRHVCMLGRSMQTHTRIAMEAGYLKDMSALLIHPDLAQTVARDKLLVIATGTQGEPAAALARLAARSHHQLALEPGDTVVLSSRIIPGNEVSVARIISNFERQGVNLVDHHSEPRIHVSGHATQSEQTRMLDLVRPQGFVPIHGTFHHLAAHARLARAAGISDTSVVENGAIVEFDNATTTIKGSTQVGRINVDEGEPIPDIVIHDRTLLAEYGIAFVVVLIDETGRLLGDPEVFTRGVIHEEDDLELIDHARDAVAEALENHDTPLLRLQDSEIREVAKRALRKFILRRTKRRPITHALVLRLE